jgi:hypothetical protein
VAQQFGDGVVLRLRGVLARAAAPGDRGDIRELVTGGVPQHLGGVPLPALVLDAVRAQPGATRLPGPPPSAEEFGARWRPEA